MTTRRILTSLDELAPAARVAIYGSGKIGVGFKTCLEHHRPDVTVSCFINSFHGGVVADTAVVPLSELADYPTRFDVIVICSSLWDQIEDVLRQRSYAFSTISNALMYETLEISRLGDFRFSGAECDQVRERLARACSWFDGDAQYHFDLLQKLRTTSDEADIFDFLKSASEHFATPYLDYIETPLSGDVILEGGVADGADTANFYASFPAERLKVYGFEPLPDVFERSTHRAALLARGLELHPWALWDANEDLRFRNDGATATTSAVLGAAPATAREDPANTVVRGVTLDSFVESRGIGRVGLVKLDIEGAELEALKGARRIISNDKPQLAIAIYHKKEHLYELPELLKEFHPGYRFKLGFYSPTFIDTVLYALP